VSGHDSDRPPVLAHLRFASDRAAFQGLGLRERFERIHTTNLWGAASSVSGLGSEQAAASAWSAALPPLLRQLNARSLLDAPCGDAQWINRLGLEVDYTGIDIVPALVRALQQRAVAGELTGRYLLADITTDPLPYADAALCRDCLVHLSFANIARAVANLRRCGARWLITTTFTALHANHDCEDGDWRPLNLCRPPFAWPAPVALLDERCDEAGGGYRDKSLGVWRFDSL